MVQINSFSNSNTSNNSVNVKSLIQLTELNLRVN